MLLKVCRGERESCFAERHEPPQENRCRAMAVGHTRCFPKIFTPRVLIHRSDNDMPGWGSTRFIPRALSELSANETSRCSVCSSGHQTRYPNSFRNDCQRLQALCYQNREERWIHPSFENYPLYGELLDRLASDIYLSRGSPLVAGGEVGDPSSRRPAFPRYAKSGGAEERAQPPRTGKNGNKARNFHCPFCTVSCSNRGQLQGHVRIHTGERPFVCKEPDCGKAFIRNEELTRHRRIHTGERPHPCSVCSKAFSRKDHLRKHLKTHNI